MDTATGSLLRNVLRWTANSRRGAKKQKSFPAWEALIVREPSLEWGAAALSLTSQRYTCVNRCVRPAPAAYRETAGLVSTRPLSARMPSSIMTPKRIIDTTEPGRMEEDAREGMEADGANVETLTPCAANIAVMAGRDSTRCIQYLP